MVICGFGDAVWKDARRCHAQQYSFMLHWPRSAHAAISVDLPVAYTKIMNNVCLTFISIVLYVRNDIHVFPTAGC